MKSLARVSKVQMNSYKQGWYFNNWVPLLSNLQNLHRVCYNGGMFQQPQLSYNHADGTIRTRTGKIVANFNKDTGYLHFTPIAFPKFSQLDYVTPAIDLAVRKAPTTVLGFK